jgi:GTPase SAR1 family protein
MEITRGIINGAQKIVIYGPEGIGKSTLAAKFPNPVFIDTEGSTKRLDVARTQPPSSWTMLMSQITCIKNNPQMCDTLIIDTADWAEKLCNYHICSTNNNKSSIEEFGYGKGYVYLAEEFGRFLNSLSDLINLGINVVLTAHAQMRKFEQPDEFGAYDRWELKLEKKVAPLIKEWADMVLFCNYKTFVVNSQGDGKGTNKVQGGKRIMYTAHHPCWDAKNRHDLKPELSLDYNEIAHCIVTRNSKPALGSKNKPAPLAQDLDEVTKEPEIYYYHNTHDDSISTSSTNEPETIYKKKIAKEEYEKIKQRKDQQAKLFPEMTKRAEASEPPKQESPKQSLPGVPKALADLMTANNVTVEEIQQVVSQRGYFPADTPFKNYPKEFVDGCLVGAWSQVFNMILENRKK